MHLYVLKSTYKQDLLSDPYCYKMLSNSFHKSKTHIKAITSTDSKTKMYQFQKNEFYAD